MKLTKAFFEEVRKLVLSARATVARGVDLVQVHTDFDIGRRIVEQEQKGVAAGVERLRPPPAKDSAAPTPVGGEAPTTATWAHS